jgi:urease accessory protein
MAWLSPAYPVGAFSYSGGVEWAVEAGDISDASTLKAWIAAVLRNGNGMSDAVFFCHAYHAAAAGDGARLYAAAELAAAFAPSRERQLETTAQGRAFLDATLAAWPCATLEEWVRSWPVPTAYPVAVAIACAGHGVAPEPALQAYVQAIAANLVSAGVRLIPLGQTDGLRILASLEGDIHAVASTAPKIKLDDVGSATFRADIAGMKHETQYTRLFRS